MTSIRNYAYALILALTAFSSMPSLAQDAAGKFTLSQAVRWQNALVPAGEYRFVLESRGPYELLTLQRLGSHPVAFMLRVPETDERLGSEPGRIKLVTLSGQSYVSTMELPQFGMTLHFTVPAEEKQMALASHSRISSAR